MLTRSVEGTLGVFAAGLIATLAAAVSLASDGATPIRVVVAVAPKMEGAEGSSTLATVWGPENRGTIESGVAEKFCAHLQERFRHWDFAPAHEKIYATLRLRLIEFPGEPNRVLFQLQRYPADREAEAIEVWRMDWLQPGDIQASGVPVPARAPDVIATSLRRIDSAAQEQAIRDWLAKVPLAAGGRWIDPAPPSVMALRLAVAMPRDRFEALTASTLKISGKAPGAPEMRLHMKGTADAEMFELEPGRAILALVVTPEGEAEWTALTVERALALKIGLIFLEKEEDPGSADFFPIGQ